jgi:Chalcone isomerase-like
LRKAHHPRAHGTIGAMNYFKTRGPVAQQSAYPSIFPTTRPSFVKRALDPIVGTVLFACFCACLGLAAAHASVVDVAGVKVPDAATVANSNLLLNGTGVRYRGPFKVYTAALYLDKKAFTREAVHAEPGTKRIVLTMLREIKAEEMGTLFMRSMEQNTPKADLLKVLPALPRMGDIFVEQRKMLPGESITIDWIPGTGTVLSSRGKTLGQPFKEPEFFHAMLDIWLGKEPADWMLKDSLLGLSR